MVGKALSTIYEVPRAKRELVLALIAIGALEVTEDGLKCIEHKKIKGV